MRALLTDAVDSLTRGEPEQSAFTYFLDADGNAILHLVPNIASVKDDLTFDVTETSGVLELTSPIRRCLIVSAGGLLLRGGSSGEVVVGNDSLIIADAIELGGSSFKVLPSPGRSDHHIYGTRIVSESSVSHAAEFEVWSYDPAALKVHWPDPTYQWRPFYSRICSRCRTFEYEMLRGSCSHCVEFSWRLKRIPMAIRLFTTNFLEQFIVGNDEAFKLSLAAVVEMGIVRREGQSYCLCRDRLGEYRYEIMPCSGHLGSRKHYKG